MHSSICPRRQDKETSALTLQLTPTYTCTCTCTYTCAIHVYICTHAYIHVHVHCTCIMYCIYMFTCFFLSHQVFSQPGLMGFINYGEYIRYSVHIRIHLHIDIIHVQVHVCSKCGYHVLNINPPAVLIYCSACTNQCVHIL